MRSAPTLLLVLSALPTLAAASCFSIYSPANQLVYQSTVNPVDLSLPISQALRPRFPGHHLVMDPNELACTEVGPGSASERGGNSSTRRQAARILETSPLLKSGRSPMDRTAAADDASDSIELAPDPQLTTRRIRRPAARASGNTLPLSATPTIR